MTKTTLPVPLSGSCRIETRNKDIGARTTIRRWMMALSLLLVPAMAQQAEARKPQDQDYCIEHGCTGDKCIVCER